MFFFISKIKRNWIRKFRENLLKMKVENLENFRNLKRNRNGEGKNRIRKFGSSEKNYICTYVNKVFSENFEKN